MQVCQRVRGGMCHARGGARDAQHANLTRQSGWSVLGNGATFGCVASIHGLRVEQVCCGGRGCPRTCRAHTHQVPQQRVSGRHRALSCAGQQSAVERTRVCPPVPAFFDLYCIMRRNPGPSMHLCSTQHPMSWHSPTGPTSRPICRTICRRICFISRRFPQARPHAQSMQR